MADWDVVSHSDEPPPQQASEWDVVDQSDEPPEPPQRTWGEEIGRDVRTFARSVIPTTAGVLGGMAAAGAAGLATAPSGPGAVAAGLAAGVAGGAAAGGAAQWAQDKLADAMGIDSPQQRAADAERPNLGSMAAEFAPAALTMSPGGLSTALSKRVLAGGVMGGLDVATQAVTKGPSNIDPKEAVVAAGVGAALPNARGWVEGITPGPHAPQPSPAGPRTDANVNAAVRTPEENAAATQTPVATSPSRGQAYVHAPPVDANKPPAGTPEGGFAATQTAQDIAHDFNEKKGRPVAQQEGVQSAVTPPGGINKGDTDPALAAALDGQVAGKSPWDVVSHSDTAPERPAPLAGQDITPQPVDHDITPESIAPVEIPPEEPAKPNVGTSAEVPTNDKFNDVKTGSGATIVQTPTQAAGEAAAAARPKPPPLARGIQKALVARGFTPEQIGSMTTPEAMKLIGRRAKGPMVNGVDTSQPIARPGEGPIGNKPLEEGPDGPVPAWLQSNRDNAVQNAHDLQVTDTIASLARQGKTATEISEAIGRKLEPDDVRAVRDSLGIKPAGPAGSIAMGTTRAEESENPANGMPVMQAMFRTNMPLKTWIERLFGRGDKTVLPEQIASDPKTDAFLRQFAQEAQTEGAFKEPGAPKPPPNRFEPTVPGAAASPARKLTGEARARAIAEMGQPRPQSGDYDRVASEVEALGLQKRPGVIQAMSRQNMPSNLSPATNSLLSELGDRAEQLSPSQRVRFTAAVKDAWRGNLIRQIFSPQTMTPSSERAGALTREVHGQKLQADAQFADRLQEAQRVINKAPAADVNDWLMNFESNSVPHGNVLAGVQPDIKAAMDSMKARMERLPEGDKLNFIENYFPRSGLWDTNDPGYNQAVQNFLVRQGSKSPLKQREFMTIPEGLANGMKFNPKILRPDGVPDPMQIIGKYLNQMSNYTESQEMLGRYIQDGIARVHDATQDGDRIFPGEIRLEGRTYRGLPVYAPKEVAEIFNNFYAPGVYGNEAAGRVFDAWMHGKGMLSSLKLLGGGYHAMAIATESMLSRFSTGLAAAVRGDPEGFKTIAKTPLAPVSHYLQGKKGLAAYLRENADPQTQAAVNALRDAGFNFSPGGQLRQNPELQYSALKSFFHSWHEGRLRLDVAEMGQRVKGAFGRNVAAGTAQLGKEMFAIVGRTMQSAMHPLFEKYIPMVKNGAALEAMGSYMKNNPDATREQMLQAARRISDSIDNRLGMIHQDNVFWNRTLKQAAQASMLSWGWNFGTVREIGGGVLKAVRSPQSLSVTNRDYDPRVAYAIAMPVLTTVMAGIYQALKTGKLPDEPPHGIGEAFTGKTGGKAARSQEPERAILPGYQKDVLGAWNNIFNPQGTGKVAGELYNKLAPAVHLGVESLTNQDWAGHPIWNPNHPMSQKLAEYFHHVGASLGPIAAEQVKQMNAGTNISAPERLLGIRPASAWIQKPAATNTAIAKKNERDWQEKQKFDQRMAR